MMLAKVPGNPRGFLPSNPSEKNRYMVYHQNLLSGTKHSHFVEIFPSHGNIVGFTQVTLVGDLGKVSGTPDCFHFWVVWKNCGV